MVWYVNGTLIDVKKDEFKKITITTKEVNDHQAYSELTLKGLSINDGGKKTVIQNYLIQRFSKT